jgi:phosphoenolpyruvate carboxykinase (ATP)
MPQSLVLKSQQNFLGSDARREVCPESQGSPDFLLNSKHAQESGLKPVICYRNLAVSQLYEMALKFEPDTAVVSTGALSALSYEKTGRSPKDKRVVREPSTEADVWWGAGSPNHPLDERSFFLNRARAVDYLNFLPSIFVFDGYANWSKEARTKIRVVSARPYHALFMHNMLIRPTEEELKTFGEPEFVIYNAGPFPANRHTSGMTSATSVDLNLANNEMVILGTQYAGCMKKGVFTMMHYLMPKRGILSLHSGCNMGANKDVTMFFGLSGTGKTTLSTESHRPLIGDDEHCWGDNGVWNIEGGCYAKCIDLQAEKEPEIWKAIRFGTILENVVFDRRTRVVDFNNVSLTENTRACYPINYIDNACIPCIGPHPKNVILLCADAFGVLPPVSKLTLEQAMYYFISGYTAKVAGTEQGITKPEATFSACFGAAFLVWHPMKYASMLAEKMKQHGTTAWLVNTGWTAGGYGVGPRMSLKHTRAIVDGIHNGELSNAEYTSIPFFNLQVPTACTGVPSEVLNPQISWKDQAEFTKVLEELAGAFTKNFDTFADGHSYVGADMVTRILAGGPQLPK